LAVGPTNVKLWVNIGTTCDRSAEQYFWRGAVATVLADTLEDAGYRVEIIAFSYAARVYPRCSNPDFQATYVLKNFEDPLNVGRIAYATAHASFLRTLTFASRMTSKNRVNYSFGHSNSGKPPGFDESSFLIDNDIWTEDDARKKLKALMEKFA